MEKEKIDGSINREVTEDFTELMNTVNNLNESQNNTDNDSFDEFEDLMKRRDYKGKVEINKKPKTSKRKLKKWVYVLLLFIIVAIGLGTYKIISDRQVTLKKEEEKKLLEDIKNHYGLFVKVNKDTNLYVKDNNKYDKIGTVYQNATLKLQDTEISVDTKFFAIDNSDYYVKYNDVEKTDSIENSDRYKNYLPFNNNIITKDSFTMYLGDDKLITLDKEMEFPIIINDYDGKYYVEYNNQLVSIKKEDIEKTVDQNNTDKKNQSKITTLAYHRVYDVDDKCTDPYVCLKKEVFDKQMKYLSDNNYFTLNLNELHMYLKGSLHIEKGVVITIDDGYLFKASDEVLDKYGLNGTMFVISGDFVDKYDQFKDLKAIDIQSHTHKMHKNYVCSGGNQGGAILCAGKEKIVSDLKTSLEALNVSPIGLAFPFYDYNETAISALKEVGFKMSFIGRAGVMGRATPKVTDLYKIPRMTVWEESLMSFNTWKSYL